MYVFQLFSKLPVSVVIFHLPYSSTWGICFRIYVMIEIYGTSSC